MVSARNARTDHLGSTTSSSPITEERAARGYRMHLQAALAATSLVPPGQPRVGSEPRVNRAPNAARIAASIRTTRDETMRLLRKAVPRTSVLMGAIAVILFVAGRDAPVPRPEARIIHRVRSG
jgi:hypothetical protein